MSPATRQLIGERELRLMKPTATLVNAARGGVVDEAALVRALREGWIGSAGLDVQQVEPNPDRDESAPRRCRTAWSCRISVRRPSPRASR